MMPQIRTDAPECLTKKNKAGIENQKRWGIQYAAKLNHPKKSNDFQWATYQKQRVNTILEPLLRDITKNHCSFCDTFPLRQSGGTIEHFNPKANEPLLSYIWTNLFYCCHKCQEKGEKFNDNLLKPDEATYFFDSFFVCRTQNERIIIVPNPLATTNDQARAEVTIMLYGLNDFGRPEDRWRVLMQYQDSITPAVDDFAYRFLFL